MKRTLTAAASLMLAAAACAQSLLGGVDLGHKFKCGVNVSAGVEYNTADWIKHTDQWCIKAAVSYKPLKWLKVGADFKFLQGQTLSDGFAVAYWDNKQRLGVNITGEIKLFKKLTLSLRERYQYTYRPFLQVPCFEDGIPCGNRNVSGKSKHLLRSRLSAEFKPYKKCRFTPYASYELYSLLADINHTKQKSSPGSVNDKWRITAGCDYKINKRYGLELFYRYSKSPDIDEMDQPHTIGLVFSVKL